MARRHSLHGPSPRQLGGHLHRAPRARRVSADQTTPTTSMPTMNTTLTHPLALQRSTLCPCTMAAPSHANVPAHLPCLCLLQLQRPFPAGTQQLTNTRFMWPCTQACTASCQWSHPRSAPPALHATAPATCRPVHVPAPDNPCRSPTAR